MAGKLAFFAIGYVLGSRAGRRQYDQLVALARWAAARDEVQTALGMAQSAIQVAVERTADQAERKRVA